MTYSGRSYSGAELAQHVHGLCRTFRVHLIEDPTFKYEEGVSVTLYMPYNPVVIQSVVVRPVLDETSYAIALHEIGHCVSPLGNQASAPTVSVITREEAAWDWARHYALDWTPAMVATEEYAMRTHRQTEALRRQQEKQRSVGLKSFLRKLDV